MQLEAALLEEYKTVRQESLEALGRVQSVAQYLFAAAGVTVTVGLVAAKDDPTVGAAVLMALIPLVVILGISMESLEIQRVLRARRHLRQLEDTLNAQIEGSTRALSWETGRLKTETRRRNLFPVILVVAVASIVVIGPGIGGLVLRDNLTKWYLVGAATDLVLAALVTIVALPIYAQLRELEKGSPSPSNGVHQQ